MICITSEVAITCFINVVSVSDHEADHATGERERERERERE